MVAQALPDRHRPDAAHAEASARAATPRPGDSPCYDPPVRTYRPCAPFPVHPRGDQEPPLDPATAATANDPESERKRFEEKRRLVADLYLAGEGIEIGALHQPLAVPPRARVRYVDRLPVAELRRHYPELETLPLVEVDVIDEGERLASVADGSLDFVIANHFLEHCGDPIAAVENMLRVLRPGGILYLACPEKRLTFDRNRPVTPFGHLLQDHLRGPQHSKRAHFEEWARLVDGVHDDAARAAHVERLLALDYSIHYHVWTQTEMLELVYRLRHDLGLPFEVELVMRNEYEVILVLRKAAL